MRKKGLKVERLVLNLCGWSRTRGGEAKRESDDLCNRVKSSKRDANQPKNVKLREDSSLISLRSKDCNSFKSFPIFDEPVHELI